jgi:hypothetical protein
MVSLTIQQENKETNEYEKLDSAITDQIKKLLLK